VGSSAIIQGLVFYGASLCNLLPTYLTDVTSNRRSFSPKTTKSDDNHLVEVIYVESDRKQAARRIVEAEADDTNAPAKPRVTHAWGIKKAELEQSDSGPSKTQRKAQMQTMQSLGEHLITLKEAHLVELNLPENLFDALIEAKRLKSHEALRRQRQLIGKLMKYADVPAIEQQLQARNFGK
jgi:Protein of unknown function (DUF615)